MAKGIGGRAGGKKTGGRKKGTPNKVSANVRSNVLEVFSKLRGVDGMAEWATNNQSEFYKIYAKLLPTDIDVNADVNGKIVIEWQKPE